jgi:hypothetical protein
LRRRAEVSARVPVGSGQVHGAARDEQPDGELLPARDRIAEANSMPPGDVTELSYAAEFYQHNAIRVTPDRQSGLENDVWARLAGGAHLRILVAIRVLGPECHEFIWSEEDDHSLRGGARQ